MQQSCVSRHSGSSLAHRNRSDFCDLRLRCPSQTPPQKSQRFPRQEKAMLHCDLRVRWKVASDLQFRAAISEPKIHSFCGISGDLAPSTRKSLAIAIVRFWCAKSSSNCLWRPPSHLVTITIKECPRKKVLFGLKNAAIQSYCLKPWKCPERKVRMYHDVSSVRRSSRSFFVP